MYFYIENCETPPPVIIFLFDNFFSKNLSKRMRTPIEKKNLVTYWPSDDNDSTDDELQNDSTEAFLNQNSHYKTYSYIAF